MFKRSKPFVKWAGGKRYLLEEIKPRLPLRFNHYFEPFIGGGAIYFELQNKIKRATISDNNEELIIAYRAIKKNPKGLIKKLKEYAQVHSKDFYYKTRGKLPEEKIERAARFIYLNKTCYNGLYRVNNSGRFNVPMGSYKNPNIIQKENILECHKALKKTVITCQDFEKINPRKGDFVYFDPPYQPGIYGGFTKYTKENFTEKDQSRLANFAKNLSSLGVYVMISNSKSKLIQKLYPKRYFRTHIVYAPRFVNCKGNKRHKVEELLITNY